MAGCSQPGPARTVTVEQYQAPKPGTPGAPHKVSQRCTGGDDAAVTISWSAASNAKHYEIYHSSGKQLTVASGTSVEIYDVPTYSPTGAYLTLYVKACNEAGCTQGPQATLWIDPCQQQQPQPPSAPGAPYKVSQLCTGGGKARVTVGWGAASGAKYYKIYHVSGEQKAVASGTSVEIYDVPTYSPTGAYLTLYVKACNEYGCTQGPSQQLWINPCS